MMQHFADRGLDFKYRTRLKINECFCSIQGEGVHSGLPCTFIRLTGCALRCGYCDTSYAFYGGSWRSFDELYDYCKEQGAHLIQITGGEPLHQKAAWPFVDGLIERGFKVLIETSGAVSIKGLHPKSHIVLDLKTPDSGECDRMLWENLDIIKREDEVKFVVCSQSDLEWSFATIKRYDLENRCQILISPISESGEKASFAERLVASGIQARFQIQMHKILWGDAKGR